MPQTIEVPGHGLVEFPDGMSDDQIVAAIQKNSPQAPQRGKAAIGGLATGASFLAGIPMDTARNIANLGLTAGGAIKNLITGRPDSPKVLPPFPGGGESIAGALGSMGVPIDNPSPQDPASRMLHTGGTILGGSLMPGGGLKSALAAATGGALAGEMAHGTKYEPYAAMAGSLVPGGIGAAGRAVKGAIAGKAAPNLAEFNAAGVDKPSVGMVTDNYFAHGIENLLAKFPGGQGVMSKAKENVQRSMGSKTKTGVSSEDAGMAIESGIKGPGGYLERTTNEWKSLDARVAAKVKPGTGIAPTETQAALHELTTPVPGAEQTTSSLVNTKIARMKDDLTADIQKNGGMLPFEALRSLRTRVGSMMDDALVSGVPGGEVKRLYGALSEDLKAAAKAGGAEKEFAAQSKYWKDRQDHIETVLEKVIGKNKSPEDIFRAFYPKDVNSVTTPLGVLRSLAPAERRIVTQAAVDRLGRASPGRQNEFGDVFSSETFLTNWGTINPKVRAQLFPDPAMRANLDAIAASAANLRHGASAFANNSGTSGSFAAYGVYGSLATGAITGNVPLLATTAAIMGGANATARLMTWPKFVNWLAKAPKKDPKLMASHIARLTVLYNSTEDKALKEDLADYINKVGEQ